MKVWTNTECQGRYLGVVAVVVAKDATTAANTLNEALLNRGLPPTATAAQFVRLPVAKETVKLLSDGDY